ELAYPRQALELACAKVSKVHAIRQCVRDQITGRLGEQYLPAMSGGADTRGEMNIQTGIPFICSLRLASMHADAPAHGDIAGALGAPIIGGERALHRYGRCDRLSSAREHDEEGVALRIHFTAMVAPKYAAQQAAACGQDIRPAVA